MVIDVYLLYTLWVAKSFNILAFCMAFNIEVLRACLSCVHIHTRIKSRHFSMGSCYINEYRIHINIYIRNIFFFLQYKCGNVVTKKKTMLQHWRTFLSMCAKISISAPYAIILLRITNQDISKEKFLRFFFFIFILEKTYDESWINFNKHQ